MITLEHLHLELTRLRGDPPAPGDHPREVFNKFLALWDLEILMLELILRGLPDD